MDSGRGVSTKSTASADALSAYEPMAAAEPSNFDLQAKVVRMLVNLGRNDEATSRAADVVMRFRASS